MAITNRRYLKDAVIAVGHQTAFGTPAGTTSVMQIRCSASAIDPQYQYVDIRGTAGSYHRKDTNWKTAELPVASLEMPCTKKALMFMAEYAMHGKPTERASRSALERPSARDGSTKTSAARR